MRCDQIFVDAPGDEWLEHGPGFRPPEGVKASPRQIGDAWRKIEAEQIGQGEDVVADAAAIGVVGCDAQVGLVVEQPVDDMGGLPGGRNRDRVVRRLAGRKVRVKKCRGGPLVMRIDRRRGPPALPRSRRLRFPSGRGWGSAPQDSSIAARIAAGSLASIGCARHRQMHGRAPAAGER